MSQSKRPYAFWVTLVLLELAWLGAGVALLPPPAQFADKRLDGSAERDRHRTRSADLLKAWGRAGLLVGGIAVVIRWSHQQRKTTPAASTGPGVRSDWN